MPEPSHSALSLPGADVFVPDGTPLDDALARLTDVVVVAHADDAEISVPAPILAAYDDPDRWVGVCVCTDGAGCPRGGAFSETGDAEMVEIRRREQREAARVGRYGILVQLAHSSGDVRDDHADLHGELRGLLAAAQPATVHTHEPADRHPTHVAVAHACIAACRTLPSGIGPHRLLGWAGWRSLDWVPAPHVVRVDVSGEDHLAAALLSVFESQLSTKRYDLAALDRRRADATFGTPDVPDTAERVTVALDMTPLLDPAVDPRTWLAAVLERFSTEVLDNFRG